MRNWTKNPEAMKKWKAEYYQKNKLVIRQRQKQDIIENPEKRKQQLEKYKASNDLAKYQREYRSENPMTYVKDGLKQRLKADLGCSIDEVPEAFLEAKLGVIKIQRLIAGRKI